MDWSLFLFDNTTNCTRVDTFQFTIDSITVALVPLTIGFNSIVLYIALHYVNLQRRQNQRFVIGMTVSDLLYGLTYMSTRFCDHLIPRILCGPYYVATWVCQIASVIFLLMLNVDKFISVRYPLKYQVIATKRSVNCQILLAWAIIIGYSVIMFYCGPVQYDHSVGDYDECSVTMSPAYYTLMLLLCYVAPLVLSLMISIYIAWVVWATQHNASGISRVRPRAPRRKRDTTKRIIFVFLSTAWTSVTFLPYRVGLTVFYLCQLRYTDPQVSLEQLAANYTWNLEASVERHLRAEAHLEMLLFPADYGKAFCQTPSMRMAITIFLCLLPLGAVGNPLVTICTQNAYLKGVAAMWRDFKSFLRRAMLHLRRPPNKWSSPIDGGDNKKTLLKANVYKRLFKSCLPSMTDAVHSECSNEKSSDKNQVL